MPVLELGHDACAGGFEVRTQGRAQLPKGYFAYESELAAQMTCVMHGRREAYEAENKDGQLPHLVDVAADEVTKMQRTPRRRAGTRPQGWPSSRRSRRAQRRPSCSKRKRLSSRAAAHTAGLALLAPVEGGGFIVCVVIEC